MRRDVRGKIEAEKLRRKCGLTGRVNVDEVASHLGISIHEWDLPGCEVEEAISKRFIAISQDMDERERRFAIAHGIGHFVMDDVSNHVWLRAHTRLGDKLEAQRDEFGYYLIVDEEEALEAGLTMSWEIGDYFGVPEEQARVQSRFA